MKYSHYYYDNFKDVNYKHKIQHKFNIELKSEQYLFKLFVYNYCLGANKVKLPADIILNLIDKYSEGIASYYGKINKKLRANKPKYLKKEELDPLQFMEIIQIFLDKLKMKAEFLNRNLNEGFSGGEKKRNEILQMLVLQPKLIILDEIDSGLDVDAIKIICEGIRKNREINSSLIVITHYPRILNYLIPNFVHIMIDGKIVKSGNMELVNYLEEKGYEELNS